jgi:hypothetical protein
MTMLRPARQDRWCERCGQQSEQLQLSTVTVVRDDDVKLTLRACAPCRKALRADPTLKVA